jgi:hypothetical protein
MIGTYILIDIVLEKKFLDRSILMLELYTSGGPLLYFFGQNTEDDEQTYGLRGMYDVLQ